MSFPRYESYKDSGVEWLGEVPEHWQHASLRYACRRITDGSHFSPKSVEDGKSYVTVRNLDCGKIDLLGAAKISPEDFQQLEKAGCRPAINDVLFSKDGTVGKVAIVEDDNFVALSSLAIIRPEFGKLAPKFLFYFLQSANGEKQIESLYAGAALRRITLDAIVGIWLPLPKLPEQQTIADFLDRETAKIDALIAEQQRLIELLKEKRQAVISHAVTKGLSPNAQMKNSGIEWLGEVPEHWGVVPIRWFARCASGNGISIEQIQTEADANQLIPVIGGNGVMGFTNLVNVEHSILAVGRVGALCGNIHIVNPPAWVTDNALILDAAPKAFNLAYLASVLRSRNLNDIASKTAQPLITGTQVRDQRVPQPPLEEQQSIAAFLDRETTKIDALTTEAKTAITLLQERRTALISAAVTGKIDVRGLA